MKKQYRHYLYLVPALIIYGLISWHLRFIQDDAYITYRYVANYLNGHGLVYNIGERVEGYTNFGWTIFLLFIGVLKANVIPISRLVGFAFGGGTIVLTYLIGRRIFSKDNFWFPIAAAYLVAFSQSLSYWSQAGLETACFAFLVLWALYLYLRRSWMLIFAMLMAVWVRPEGAIVTGLLIIIEAIQDRRLPRFTLMCAGTAFVLSLPFVGFKLFYYKSILPNPFYAKTSFDFEQIKSGWEYTSRFASHYPIYIAGVVLPLLWLVWKRLRGPVLAVWLFAAIYTLYIFFVGGDVLKVHRFYLPLFGPMALMALWMIADMGRRWVAATRYMVLFVAMIGILAATWWLPKAWVDKYDFAEKAFTAKMLFKAQEMKKCDDRNFSVAVATIGIFGYELLGHDIIDMVGLTDSTIARYSEPPIPGMETTWKEQKHNSAYILKRAPDYILFSTGIKPSAPAERALLLYRQFMDSYRTVGWYYRHPLSASGVISSAFRRVRPIEGEIVPVYPVQYVEYYKTALDYHTKSDHANAVKYYDLAMKASPQPYFVYLIYQKAYSLMKLGYYEQSLKMLNDLVARDSTVFEAHMDLYRFAVAMGDSTKAEIHKRWLLKLVPWYWPRIDAAVRSMMTGRQEDVVDE